MSDFKLTHASMFNPPEEVHERFEATLANMKATQLGKTHAMLINNQDVVAESTYENRSPINRHWLLAQLQAGTSQHAEAAVTAARAAFPAWSKTDWRERVRLVMIGSVPNLDEALTLTNDTVYGLTGGFFGTAEEAQWYFERIQVGTSYANRLQGASTGAWPGYQDFGGWKGSGASGKGTGGPYYILSYLREQSQTVVELNENEVNERERKA